MKKGEKMKVKKYKKLNNSLYEIELEDKRKIKLYDDVILKYELLIIANLTEQKLDKIIEENETLEAYYKALKYLTTKMRSEKEIKEYLTKYEYSKQAIDYTIERLKREKYINEEQYIKSYIHDALALTLDGPEKILFKLNLLGLSTSKTHEEINLINKDIWYNRINNIIAKKYKSNKSSINIFKQKIYTHLMTLGYENNLIKESIEQFGFEENEENFIKEANKTWNKLLAKVEPSQINYYFKNKMLQKGYNMELISDYLSNKKEY